MDAFKLLRWLQEFTFLGKVCEQAVATRILDPEYSDPSKVDCRVQRIDEGVLERAPFLERTLLPPLETPPQANPILVFDLVALSRSEHFECRELDVFLVDDEGKVFCCPNGWAPGALFASGEFSSDRIKFVVTKLRTWNERSFQCSEEIVIYKPPKSFTIKEWLARRMRKEGDELAATLASIDMVD